MTAMAAPTNQTPMTRAGVPRSPTRKAGIVKMPVPIMFDTTMAVALTKPMRRTRGESVNGPYLLAEI